MKKWCIAVGLLFSFTLFLGCGTTTPPSTPDPNAKPAEAKVVIPEIEAWKIVRAFTDDETKAKAEYQGKTFIVNNLLVYGTEPERNFANMFAFDPTSKAISCEGNSKFNGETLIASDDFFLEVFFAEPKTAETIKDVDNEKKDGQNVLVNGKNISLFYTHLNLECTINHESGNSVMLKNAKVIKK